MSNFTPLKKNKKPFGKLFLFANLFLLLIVVGITTYYFKDKLFPSTNQAAGPQSCPVSGYVTDCQDVSEPGACGNDQGNHCEGNEWCRPYRLENKCYNNSSHSSAKWCCKGTDYNCSVVEGKCGVPGAPTDTPIPTPTGSITDTPIPTATVAVTPTDVVTSTPVPTATIEVTNTPAPTSTGVPASTLTPVPVLCGTKGCDNATNPCRSGLSCVQASDGSNYCTNPDFVVACKANPSYTSCCTAPGSSTPTEIVVAKSTVAPAPVTGNNSWYMFAFPILAIIGGLLL